MKNKIIFILLLMVFMLVPSVHSAYTHIGGDNRDYKGSTSAFNTEALIENTSYIVTPGTTMANYSTPLVSDLDGDGINEILFISATKLYIYDTTLTIIDSYSFTGALKDSAQTMDIVDFDNDGNKEIAVGGGDSSEIEILRLNTSILQVTNYSIESGVGNAAIIQCDDTEELCYYINHAPNANLGWLKVVPFNNVRVGNHTSFTNRIMYNTGNNFCLPKYGGTIADYDDDNRNELIIAGLQIDGGFEDLIIYYIQFDNLDTNLSHYSVERTITRNLANFADDAIGENCENIADHGGQYKITPPIVANLDKAGLPKLETLVGVGYEADNFQMYLYNSDGSEIDNYPESPENVGTQILNVYLSDWYEPNTGFCMQILNQEDNEIVVRCANNNKPSGFFGGSDTEKYTINTQYNITPGATMLSHSIKSNSTTASSEHLSNYGVYQELAADESMTQLFDLGISNVVVIPVDVDKDSLDDLVIWDNPSLRLFTTTAKKYGCDSQPQQATYSTCYEDIILNPCTTQTWLQNSSIETQIVFYDYDSSNLQANVTVYADHTNSQTTGKKGNFTSGESAIFSVSDSNTGFLANVTGSNFKLRVNIWDLDKPTEVNTITKFFTVSDEFGITIEDGCRETIAGVAPVVPSDEFVETPTVENDNTITNALSTVTDLTNLSQVIIYFLILGLIIYGTVELCISNHYSPVIPAFLIFVIGVIVGSLLGILSFVYLIIIFLMLTIGAAISIRSVLLGNSGGG